MLRFVHLQAARIVASGVLVALLAPAGAAAYPISPMTLWELTDEAELVVLARVQHVTDPAGLIHEIAWRIGDLLGWDLELPTTATLRVLEVWKGSAGRRIDVTFDPFLICPAPARYVPRETVIAFLHRSERAGRWWTVGLSYGTIYPRTEDVDIYRGLVRRATELRGRGNVTERAYRDWLVTAATRRATRWHGLYGLVPQGDELHWYYDRSAREPEGIRLTERQMRRVAEGFVTEPSVDRTLPMVLRLLAGYPDPALSETAVQAIEAALLQDPVPSWLPEAMALVLLRYGDPDPASRLEGLGEWSWEIDPVALRSSWDRAKDALGIPWTAPLVVPPQKVPGTAETTPS